MQVKRLLSSLRNSRAFFKHPPPKLRGETGLRPARAGYTSWGRRAAAVAAAAACCCTGDASNLKCSLASDWSKPTAVLRSRAPSKRPTLTVGSCIFVMDYIYIYKKNVTFPHESVTYSFLFGKSARDGCMREKGTSYFQKVLPKLTPPKQTQPSH